MVRARMDNMMQALSKVGLFAHCTKRELQAVARLCTPMSFAEGHVLTTEGALGHECFVIADGQATVTIGGRQVGTVGPGDCVGEMSLLDGGRRTATVTATGPMTVYVLSAREFRSLLDISPTIVRRIAVSLARRLRAAEADYPH